MAIQADISKEEEVKKLISKSIEKFGKIDILVNNAGIVFDEGYEEKTVEHWNQTLNTNLVGQFLMIKHSISFMANGSKIINISSTDGTNNYNCKAMDYGCSKAAVVMLTKGFAEELASKNILVNSIAPGWINTEMNNTLSKEFLDEAKKEIWLHRMAEPKEVAELILFLSSDKNTYITGQVLQIDGGHK